MTSLTSAKKLSAAAEPSAVHAGVELALERDVSTIYDLQSFAGDFVISIFHGITEPSGSASRWQ
jgi:hypothetical protein